MEPQENKDPKSQTQKPATVQATNPPINQTKMIAPQKKGQATYKLVALQPFMIGGIEFGPGGSVLKDTTRVVQPKEIVEVSKKEARDLTKPIYGSYAFSGQRHNADGDTPRHILTRARLALPADLQDQKPLTPLDENDILAD